MPMLAYQITVTCVRVGSTILDQYLVGLIIQYSPIVGLDLVSNIDLTFLEQYWANWPYIEICNVEKYIAIALSSQY